MIAYGETYYVMLLAVLQVCFVSKSAVYIEFTRPRPGLIVQLSIFVSITWTPAEQVPILNTVPKTVL